LAIAGFGTKQTCRHGRNILPGGFQAIANAYGDYTKKSFEDPKSFVEKTLLYRASKLDCDVCPLKPQCCPKEPSRKIPCDIHEHARDVARSFAGTEGFEQSRRERKKIEMRFAHLKRILRLGRLRLRGPRGAQDEFVLAAIAPNLRRLASLVARPPPAQALGFA
jgi:hypothetical protein